MTELTIETVRKDPDFWTLPEQEQRKVFNEITSGAGDTFIKLPFEEREKIREQSLKEVSTITTSPVSETSDFPSEEISTITTRPVSELHEFPDPAKVGDFVADIAPPVAATVGGVLGAGAGAGWASAATGIGGAGLGGVAGEAYRQLWYGLTGRPGEIPETSFEAVKDMSKAGLEEMMWEGVGLGVGIPFRAAKKAIGRPATKALSPTEELPVRYTKEGKPVYGVDKLSLGELTYGEAMEDGWLRTVVENIENIGTLGKHNVSKAKKIEKATESAKLFINEATNKKQEPLQKLLYDALNEKSTGWERSCSKYYDGLNSSLDITAMMKGQSNKFINTKKLKQEASIILKTAKEAGISGDVVAELERVMGMEKFITFEAAKLRWGAMFNTTDKTLKKQLKSLGDSFKSDVREQVKIFDTTGTCSKHWEAIDKVYKDGKKLFNDKVVSNITKGTTSDELHKFLVIPNNGDNIKKVREALFSKVVIEGKVIDGTALGNLQRYKNIHTWENLQTTVYDKLLNKATDINNVLSGKNLKKQIKNLGSTFDVVFEPWQDMVKVNHKNTLNSLADHLIRLEHKPAGITFTTLAIAAPVGGGLGYSLMSGEDPAGTVKRLVLVGGTVVGTAGLFGLISRTKTGLKILKTITSTPVKKTGVITSAVVRLNKIIERREEREAWLENREKERLEKEVGKNGVAYHNEF